MRSAFVPLPLVPVRAHVRLARILRPVPMVLFDRRRLPPYVPRNSKSTHQLIQNNLGGMLSLSPGWRTARSAVHDLLIVYMREHGLLEELARCGGQSVRELDPAPAGGDCGLILLDPLLEPRHCATITRMWSKDSSTSGFLALKQCLCVLAKLRRSQR